MLAGTIQAGAQQAAGPKNPSSVGCSLFPDLLSSTARELMSRPSRNPDYPVSLQQIYDDWSHRRQGLLIALTEGAQLSPRHLEQLMGSSQLQQDNITKALRPELWGGAEVDDFYKQCDPDRENLCLYGAGLSLGFAVCPCQQVRQDQACVMGQVILLESGPWTFLQKKCPQSCQSPAWGSTLPGAARWCQLCAQPLPVRQQGCRTSLHAEVFLLQGWHAEEGLAAPCGCPLRCLALQRGILLWCQVETARAVRLPAVLPQHDMDPTTHAIGTPAKSSRP